MKRLTIEQAERIPQRLSMRNQINKVNKSKCNQIRHGWEHYDHHRIHTWNHIERFILKYVGKKWNDCYSDFKKWIDSDRKFKSEEETLINQFKEHFSNFEAHPWYRKYSDFSVNKEGLIVKTENFERKSKRSIPVYREYIYVYVPKEDPYEWYRKSQFIRNTNQFVYEECIKGLSESRFYELRDMYPHLSGLAKVPVGEPITDKAELSKIHYESRDRERKAARKNAKRRSEEILNFGSFATARERKKAAKRRQQELAKQEAAANAIERDRLGFAEDSFTTYQKFTNGNN